MPVLYESKDKKKPETRNKKEDADLVKGKEASALQPGEKQRAEVVEKRVRDEKDYSEVMREEKRTSNPLSSFMVRPKRVRVEVQDKDEKILLLLRRHFFTNLKWIFTSILMILAPLLLQLVPLLAPLPPRFQVAAILLWYLLTLGLMIEGFLSWYFNVFIVTDERVIDVDFLNLIYKNISAAKIEQIEDVTVEVTGAIRSVLGFGTVYIQTAAEKTQFEFEDVPQPQKVAKFLNEMILEEEQERIEGRVR